MSNWTYVFIAYGVVWGALVLYAIVLARRVNAAQNVARSLRQSFKDELPPDRPDSKLCDAPPET